MQNKIPKSRSLWPSMPRKFTDDKSGSFRFASPPGASASTGACAKAAAAPNSITKNPVIDFNAVRQKLEPLNEGKVSIKRPPLRRWSHLWRGKSTFDLPPDKDSLAGAYSCENLRHRIDFCIRNDPVSSRKYAVWSQSSVLILKARLATAVNVSRINVAF